jgi:hypothetical protein
METAFGLQVPESGTIPCPREMVLMSLLPPFPPEFSTLVEWTAVQEETVWLAIYFPEEGPKA